MYFVFDPFKQEEVSGPFQTFEDARQDASEWNIAGDLLILRDSTIPGRFREVCGDIYGAYGDADHA